MLRTQHGRLSTILSIALSSRQLHSQRLATFCYTGQLPGKECMHEPSQTNGQAKTRRKRLHIPPPSEMVENYAQKVCHHMRQGDGASTDIQFVQAFTNFVKTVVRIQTKYLNPGEEHVR